MRAALAAIALPISFALAMAGCKGADADFSAFKDPPWSDRDPPVEDQVTMLYQGSQPHERLQGMVFVAGHSWGLQEPYLARYAQLLREDGDASVRRAAARFLGKSGDVKYLGDVAAALSDKSDRVRWAAAVALEHLVGPAAVGPLAEHAVSDSSADVRAACASALKLHDGKDVERALIQCLEDPVFAVRFQAHKSLVRITGEDLGYDAANWTSPSPRGPTTRSVGTMRRPWWDWLGVTDARGRRRAEQTQSRKQEPESPWWDWMGVTENKPTGRP